MFSCRRLKLCWRSPYGRLLAILAVLGVLGLGVIPNMVKTIMVTKYMAAISQTRINETTARSIRDGTHKDSPVSLTEAASLTQGPPQAEVPDTRNINSSEKVKVEKGPTSDNNQSNSITPALDVSTGATTTWATQRDINKTKSVSTISASVQQYNVTNAPTVQQPPSKDADTKKKRQSNVTQDSPKLPSATQNSTSLEKPFKKILIYLCDSKMYCYGLGDRQRGIISVYLLAEMINRRFGIVMTAPSKFTEFYMPNLVQWDVQASELQGRSTKEIVAYGPKVDLKLHQVDFDAAHPEDVIYIRTNQKFQNGLLNNPHYKGRLPAWMNVAAWRLSGLAWLRLMTPTPALRQDLNQMLLQVAQNMLDESKVKDLLADSRCCQFLAGNKSLCQDPKCHPADDQISCCTLDESTRAKFSVCHNFTCGDIPKLFKCSGTTCSKYAKTNCTSANTTCPDTVVRTFLRANSSGSGCVQSLTDKTRNNSESDRLEIYARKYCEEWRPVLTPKTSLDQIKSLKGYDRVDLNLICVHIRLGHSATLPFENNVRNQPKTVVAVWEFLKPYMDKGHHVYLATDSQEVRSQAKSIFGERLHVSSVPIVHIAVVRKGDDERAGFSLTLMEQLLLATSCKILVISYSGFSMKAAQLRSELAGGPAWDLFMFRGGSVYPKGVKWLMK